jgi:hypothetical protein
MPITGIRLIAPGPYSLAVPVPQSQQSYSVSLVIANPNGLPGTASLDVVPLLAPIPRLAGVASMRCPARRADGRFHLRGRSSPHDPTGRRHLECIDQATSPTILRRWRACHISPMPTSGDGDASAPTAASSSSMKRRRSSAVTKLASKEFRANRWISSRERPRACCTATKFSFM